MKVNTYNISNEQIAALDNIAKQSAQNASKSLSRLINTQVEIDALTTQVLPPTQLSDKYGSPEDIFTTVVLKIINGINATILFCMPFHQAEKMAAIILPENKEETKPGLTDLEESALKEVANVIAGSFLLEMSKAVDHKLVQSIPDIATDMIKAILDELSSEIAMTSQNSLAISINLHIKPIDIKGCITLLLDADSANKILTKLNGQS